MPPTITPPARGSRGMRIVVPAAWHVDPAATRLSPPAWEHREGFRVGWVRRLFASEPVEQLRATASPDPPGNVERHRWKERQLSS